MPNLLLCMTPGVELRTWENIGIFERELKPYVEYVNNGWKVRILTFDKSAIPELPVGIEAVRFPSSRILAMLPWTHGYLGKWADVIKTNQSLHAYFYTQAAKVWGKPILLRCGYVQGEYLETTHGKTYKTGLYQALEAKAFKDASHCEVPTLELSRWVQKRYRVPQDKISVVPNFVDTDVFKPFKDVKKIDRSVISIGRLHPVKRFDLLINACSQIPGCTLTIIGDGLERSKLQLLAAESKLRLDLPGRVAHENLPEIINRHQVFAITSEREGHPKALVEAMACEMPCLAVDSVGISSMVTHRDTGWIVDGTVSAVRDGLNTLFGDAALCDALSRRARDLVAANYGFSNIFYRELEIVKKLTK